MIILSDQHCSGGGAGGAEKTGGEVSSDIFCMVKKAKKQQNEVFFKLFWQGLSEGVNFQN